VAKPSLAATTALLVIASWTIDARADDGSTLFRERVRIILTDACMSCHDASTRKGGLDLSHRDSAVAGGESGVAIESGKPETSLLIERVEAGEMPPNKHKLSDHEVAALKSWITLGAPYEGEALAARRAGPDWWSLRPIGNPEPPVVKSESWVRNPIDRFVLTGLLSAGMAPAPEADRRTLLRRVTFDLTGMPPTPTEIDDFLADSRPDAYEHVVDRLLASSRFGERWARHWLDAVRFGESHGYETNILRPNAWPYRDWVIRAFNEDLPFNQFVAEQLAGDSLAEGDWLARSATGFLVGGVHDIVGNATPEGMKQQRVDDLDDMITATGTAFLGLTVHCARCHDHKFDPIKQADYYGMQAIIAGVEHGDRAVQAPDADRRKSERKVIEEELARLDAQCDDLEPLTGPGTKRVRRGPVEPRRNVERFLPVAARWVRFTVHKTADGAEPCIDELEIYAGASKNLAVASTGAKATASSVFPNNPLHAIEHLNDGQHGNARSWISREAGRGWAMIELPQAAEIDRVVWGRDRPGDYRDRLASDYQIEVASEPGVWRVVADSSDRSTLGDARSSGEVTGKVALRMRLASLAETVPVYAGTFKTPAPTHLLRRGDPMQPEAEVSPSGLGAVKPALSMNATTPEPERRLALARWIADPNHPLAPRVAVNRLWHHHFGRGIVATPGDFGFNGDRPSPPELLDWLARQFLSNGGRLKPIHRLIVTSATYRQSSRIDPNAIAKDRENRLLWRMSPRRLEAEAIRDAMLLASGSLDLRMGGPGYSLWEENSNYVMVFKSKIDLGPETNRRMIYQLKPRSQPDPTFGAFDCPDAALVAPRRNTSITALQALNLLNSRFVLAQSRAMADRLKREAGDDPEAQTALAFRIVFGRDPSKSESDAAIQLVLEHGAPALTRALFNSNEFVYVN